MKLIPRSISLYERITRHLPAITLTVLLLLTRIVWGYAFFVTGKGKLQNLDRVAHFFATLNIPAPHANAIFIGCLECFGGLFLLVGLFSRPIAFLMIGNLTVAYLTTEMDALKTLFTDGKPQDFFNADPFYFLAASVLILALGPGKLSLDALLQWLLHRHFKKESVPLLGMKPDGSLGRPALA